MLSVLMDGNDSRTGRAHLTSPHFTLAAPGTWHLHLLTTLWKRESKLRLHPALLPTAPSTTHPTHGYLDSKPDPKWLSGRASLPFFNFPHRVRSPLGQSAKISLLQKKPKPDAEDCFPGALYPSSCFPDSSPRLPAHEKEQRGPAAAMKEASGSPRGRSF